jgi:hypothetical protein
MALRVKASKLSGVSENPSFSKASVALIRYGLWDLTFIILRGHQLPVESTEFYPMDSPGNSSLGFDEMPTAGPMGRNVD